MTFCEVWNHTGSYDLMMGILEAQVGGNLGVPLTFDFTYERKRLM